MKRLFLFLTLFVSIMGCSAPTVPATTSPIAPSTPVPITPTMTTTIEVTCADLDTAWGNGDWEVTLDVLAQLKTAVSHCGSTLIAEKQYAAHINYGITLENNGETEKAITQFQSAYQTNIQGPEAVAGLTRLNAKPWDDCAQTGSLPAYQSTQTNKRFLQIHEGKLFRNDEDFQIKGVNYYPRFAPWSYFWPESKLHDIEEEFQLISANGFNSIRLFLHHDFFFTCTSDQNEPIAETFNKLDAIIHLAAKYDLGIILTLNDLPDLTFEPLYTNPASSIQTKFIVQRYQNEPTILAWDLRNEGDIDYDANPSIDGHFTKEVVLSWLAEQANIVRQNDPNHLITAGWWGDPSETAVFVDFVSFHHWSDANELAQRLAAYKTQTDKPILLEEVGYPAQGSEGETYQLSMFLPILDVVNDQNLAGWLAWAAFDFAPYNDPFANQEKYFGLWQYDLSPKAFVNSLDE